MIANSATSQLWEKKTLVQRAVVARAER